MRSRIGIMFLATMMFSAVVLARQDLRVAVDLVLLDVNVSDGAGHSIRNLRQEDFTIYEDKVEQRIEYFSTEEAPVSWGLVLDRSGSMADMRNVHEAARQIIEGGTTENEMFVMTFAKTIDRMTGLTADQRLLRDSILDLHPVGTTALWDAVSAAMDSIKTGQHRRKALLVITDGADNKSRLTFTRLLDRVKESDVLIYAVGVNMASGTLAKGRADRGQLEKLSEVTGGYAHFPIDPEKSKETIAEIAREVSEHYTVGYYSVNKESDGRWRKTKVSVTSPAHVRYSVRTRSGYFQ